MKIVAILHHKPDQMGQPPLGLHETQEKYSSLLKLICLY